MTQFCVFKCNDIGRVLSRSGWLVGLQGPNMFQVCAKRKEKRKKTLHTTKANVTERQTAITETPVDSTRLLSLSLEQCMACLLFLNYNYHRITLLLTYNTLFYTNTNATDAKIKTRDLHNYTAFVFLGNI